MSVRWLVVMSRHTGILLRSPASFSRKSGWFIGFGGLLRRHLPANVLETPTNIGALLFHGVSFMYTCCGGARLSWVDGLQTRAGDVKNVHKVVLKLVAD